ncbi:hypothetical protein COY05_00020 [Candidatus Peregrinibacteria bacterium CG_4_10_14_0_2_um_filter_38_24]|nr:MAG: hypothetical protein COY05_00020 [Candidatus Peregrinibacteria bacterium CG_4_10_14_0_2_um_filter_38_24]PJC38505.1 MAG: hypothetical protein CO044_04625 [Candidatus Peregrinibacteria bacterium CG_4_9_14_0_2_um_filter_38_9]
MPNLSYLIATKRQDTQIKSYAILCGVLLLAFGIFFYTKWQEYSTINTFVDKNKAYISALKEQGSNEKALFDSKKDAINQLKAEIETNLTEVFPISDSYTELTRKFDTFEQKLVNKDSIFEISNIEYQNVAKRDNYSILPLRMSIRSSKDNFEKFLHYIETSGSLSDRVRLMDVSSVRLNFEKSNDLSGKKEEIINFSVQINAYFQ